MELLLRRSVATSRKDTVDHALSGATLRLGSAADCDFQIAGLTATVQLRGGRDGDVKLRSRPPRLQLEGGARAALTLSVGEVATLEGLSLRVFRAPAGFDCGLEVIGDVVPDRVPDAIVPIQPWSLRRTSWLLFLGVLLLFLALPYLLTRWTPPAALASLPLPSDQLWSSGPLAAAHQTVGIAKDCSNCHQQPFQMVPDDSCTDCHQTLREHSDVEAFAALELDQMRCASCHREHNEPAALVRRDDPLCSNCHADPSDWRHGADNPQAVQAFSAAGHPEFRLSHWVPLGTGAALGWELQRERSAPMSLRENSGLKFNHAVHLDPGKVQITLSGEALQCASCHAAAGDGEHFEPLRMDRHCRSCHQLNFDPFDPDIELPHGNTRAAFEAMEAHYIREFSDPTLRAERALQKPRRLPGKRMGVAACAGDGLSCGRDEAALEASYQFADSGCVSCHEVLDTGAASTIDRWFVHPVRLTDDWYSEARFSHRSHLSLDGSSGDDACVGCHEARDSVEAHDVLIPARANCLDCHSAERRDIVTDCVACHRFHRPQGTPAVHARRPTVARREEAP